VPVGMVARARLREVFMNRIAIFLSGGIDESEELAQRLADLMHEHTRHEPDRSKVGYVVALARMQEPEEYDEFVELVLEVASLAIIGPRDDD
jgi:hypothetical protein